MKKNNAFTLAEVLITLSIIGIVAALTIPQLSKYKDEVEAISGAKKAYAVLSDAYSRAAMDHGTPENWGLSNFASPNGKILSMLAPYLKLDKDCTDGSKGCFPAGVVYKYLSGADFSVVFDDYTRPKVRLKDGMLIEAENYMANCAWQIGSSKHLQNTCGWIQVDVNGAKKPNRLGYDLFSFYLTKYGIIPAGTPAQTDGFSASCKLKASQLGNTCAAWVIINGNRDYLRCNDLDWNTKSKCGN